MCNRLTTVRSRNEVPLSARQTVQLSFHATPSLQREVFLATDVCHTVARSAVTNTASDYRVACGNVGSL